MNTVNILWEHRISNTPPPSPPRSRAASHSNLLHLHHQPGLSREANDVGAGAVNSTEDQGNMGAVRVDGRMLPNTDVLASEFDEKTPLLNQSTEGAYSEAQASKTWLIPRRFSAGVIGAVKVVLTAVVAPGRYVLACFYDEDGRFSILSPIYKISRPFTRRSRKKPTGPLRASDAMDLDEKDRRTLRRISVSQYTTKKSVKRSPSVASSSTALSSDSDMDSERPPTRNEDNDPPSRHTRSRSNASSTADEIAPAKRSIRIKLHNDEALRQRKTKKGASRSGSSKDGSTHVSPEAAAALKSPTGPPTMSSRQMTRFPRTPQPPRPLVPRRQPSYSASGTSAVGPHQKTLIIDLDETLIHSMAKGGPFARGHMVEVKLQQSMAAPGQVIGPQVPILYYVHKRPHCDEFLKKVCKWYNLIAFTASVQEYADPVVDWLESERKYFAGRYYRQHCTLRNGAYIKDLAQVEPDLSKVMIIDNSPISYAFHPDNAIPIEGWLNDPTDNALLHLIPLLEGLQYVTDVRALLALRAGQPPAA